MNDDFEPHPVTKGHQCEQAEYWRLKHDELSTILETIRGLAKTGGDVKAHIIYDVPSLEGDRP